VSWPTVEIKKVARVVGGATPKSGVAEYWDGEIAWATPKDLADLDGKEIADTPRKITDRGLRSCAAEQLPPGSVLFSSRAPIGHIAINSAPMATNQGFKSFIPGPDLDASFLYWWLDANRERLQAMGNGATFKEVSKAVVERIVLPLPPLPEQRRIAAILDQADALRHLRRQSLSRLSDLGQAIFAEMFGNGSDDLLQSVQLTDVALKVTDGEHLTPRRSKSGYRLLSARNVRDGFIDFDNVDYVDELEFQRIAKRCLPRKGDVLISCSGSVGRVALVESKEPFVLVRSAALVVPNTSLIDARYLSEYLRTPRMFRLMNKRANSSGQPNLFLNQIKQLPILLPSINRQREFSRRFMALRSNLLPTMTEASHRLNGLFASLQHRAFRGEL
jgi:type I restriction enzyme S subunit